MIRKIGKVTLLPCFLPGIDNVSKDIKTVKEADLSMFKKETGWERVQQLFKKDDFGRLTPEVHTIIQVTCFSSFIGALYGGFTNSRETYIDFIKNNQATSFANHLEAKKLLQDRMTISFSKGAFRWGWRLTLFSTTYIVVSTLYSTYQGKNGIIEHTMAGTAAGSLYKFKLGPKAMLVGGGLGAVLGSIGGTLSYQLLHLTGMTMQDVRYWNYKWHQARTDTYNRELRKHIQSEQIQILTEREETMKSTGSDLSSIDDKETK